MNKNMLIGAAAIGFAGALLIGGSAAASSTNLGSTGGQVTVPGAIYEHVTGSLTQDGAPKTGYAQCDSGYVPISGGLQDDQDGQSFITSSYPDYVNNRWVITLLGSVDSPPRVFPTHAVCVKFTN